MPIRCPNAMRLCGRSAGPLCLRRGQSRTTWHPACCHSDSRRTKIPQAPPPAGAEHAECGRERRPPLAAIGLRRFSRAALFCAIIPRSLARQTVGGGPVGFALSFLVAATPLPQFSVLGSWQRHYRWLSRLLLKAWAEGRPGQEPAPKARQNRPWPYSRKTTRDLSGRRFSWNPTRSWRWSTTTIP